MYKKILIPVVLLLFILQTNNFLFANENTEAEREAEETSINLRSSYAEVSVSQVQQIPHKSMRKVKGWGFYGHSTISHIYEKESINGDKVVVDNSTGLTWHQSGSEKKMGLKKVKIWLKNINEKGYAGSNDWRLPTVEEALSLLESTKSNDGLYIDSVFAKKQDWIWTGDSFKPSDKWLIEFSKGSVRWRNPFLESFFVRPLRSGVTQIHEEDKVSAAILQKEKSEREAKKAERKAEHKAEAARKAEREAKKAEHKAERKAEAEREAIKAEKKKNNGISDDGSSDDKRGK